jgi:hypothetical protein
MLLWMMFELGVASVQLPPHRRQPAVDCTVVPADPVISTSVWPAAAAGDGAWLGDSSASLQGWNVYQKALVDGATGPGGAQYIHQLITERLPGLGALVMEPPRTAFSYGGNGGAGGSNETQVRCRSGWRMFLPRTAAIQVAAR